MNTHVHLLKAYCPSIGHSMLELIGVLLGLLTCRKPHIIEVVVYFIDELLGVLFNLTSIESKRVHPSEIS